jgi:methionyl-tRNA formyltransferase
MKIIFAGTPEFGLPCLEALYASTHQLIAIYTQPDRPAGRGQKIQESAVKIWGQARHIPIYQPVNFKSPETVAELRALESDVMIVIAYGLILPKDVLAIPRFGCINVHASILPRWRGAAPIQHAILAGDTETGVTIMQMDVGMDTGPTFLTRTCPIAAEDTAAEVHHHLSTLAAEPLMTVIDKLTEGSIPIPQPHEQANYAPKIHKQDAAINWNQPAVIIDRHIRGYYPWPIAFTQSGAMVFRIHKAQLRTQIYSQAPGTIVAMDAAGMLVAAKEGAILIQTIQCPGGRPISIADYLNARRSELHIGTVLQ